MGQGVCIPVDADTTDGKVKTTAWETREWNQSYRDDPKGEEPKKKEDRVKLEIPSISAELECSASRLVLAASTLMVMSFSI